MRESAIYFYENGYNCSQCILKAAEQIYGLRLSKQSLDLCKGVNTGFGTGDICSLLVAGVMVFGMMFDEATTKRMRMRLFDEVKLRHKGLYCGQLIKNRDSRYDRCAYLVGDIAAIIGEIIDTGR